MKQRAFTIIELLIVVIILGVLIGIALPRFVQARDKTITKEGLSILSILINGAKMKTIEEGSGATIACSESGSPCKGVLNVTLPNSLTWTERYVVNQADVVVCNTGGFWKLSYDGANITCTIPAKCGCTKWNADNMACVTP